MGMDLKYGQVTTEQGTIGEREPVFILRAQDALSGEALKQYKELCESKGSPQQHLDGIQRARDGFLNWQAANPTKVPGVR